MPKRAQLEALINDIDWVESFTVKYTDAEGPLKTPCLEWQGGLDRSGYGRVHIKKHHETGTRGITYGQGANQQCRSFCHDRGSTVGIPASRRCDGGRREGSSSGRGCEHGLRWQDDGGAPGKAE